MASYYGSATSSAGDGTGHTPAAYSADDATIAGAAEHSAAPGATEHGSGSMASYYALLVPSVLSSEAGSVPQPAAPAGEMASQEKTPAIILLEKS